MTSVIYVPPHLKTLDGQIKDLQGKIKANLIPISIQNPREQTHEWLKEEYNFFNIKSNEMNDQQKKTYLDFLRFCNQEIKKTQDELRDNTGPIFSFKPYDSGFNPEFLELYKKYVKLDDKDLTHHKTKEGLMYPNYIEDMFMKKKTESSSYFREKSDAEIKTVLDQRIESLKSCYQFLQPKNEEEIKKLKFYINEFMREQDMIGNSVKDRCRKINWGLTGKKLFENADNSVIKQEKIKTDDFLRQNPNQMILLRTFLNDSYFIKNEDGSESVNYDKILQDRTRQYVFGYDYVLDEEKVTTLPLLFETMGIIFDLFYNCGQYVNWSLLTNLLYDYCAINQTDM